MTAGILIAVGLYSVIYAIDYLFYVEQKEYYEYVSRRTWLLFILGQIATIALFSQHFSYSLEHITIEVAFLALLLGFMAIFTKTLVLQRLLVCSITSRTERCLTPGYVFVKGADIVFQQLIYAVIALMLVEAFGLHWYVFLLFTFILTVMHCVIVVSCSKEVIKMLIFGMIILPIPTMYIFVVLEVFWPAVYLHTLLYVFYWLISADFDGKVDN